MTFQPSHKASFSSSYSTTYDFLGYYPFGMEMPRRSFTSESYRFGFNGMEKEGEEWTGTSGNHLDFGARIYDSRLGRWLSTDPLEDKYPSLSPFNSAANNPIYYIDPDGEKYEWYITRKHRREMKTTFKKELGKALFTMLYQRLKKSDFIYEVKDSENFIDFSSGLSLKNYPIFKPNIDSEREYMDFGLDGEVITYEKSIYEPGGQIGFPIKGYQELGANDPFAVEELIHAFQYDYYVNKIGHNFDGEYFGPVVEVEFEAKLLENLMILSNGGELEATTNSREVINNYAIELFNDITKLKDIDNVVAKYYDELGGNEDLGEFTHRYAKDAPSGNMNTDLIETFLEIIQ